MYGKIFDSIFDGSLYGHFEALVTFKAIIVLADADGVLDMSPQAIAGRTSYPIEVIKKGLQHLQQSDPHSRSQSQDGKRILLLDENREFGWKIVNYAYYRNLSNREDKKQKDRNRIAQKRENSNKNNDVAMCRNVSPDVADVAYTNTNTNTNTEQSKDLQKRQDVYCLPLKNGDTWTATNEMIFEWVKTYPDIDIPRQFIEARRWLIDNKDRQKTSRGMRKFIGSWLSRTSKEVKKNGTSKKLSAVDRVAQATGFDMDSI